MGEQQNQPFQLSFNSSLKVDFRGSRVTSDGGLLLVRELDERLGLSELISEHLTDSRWKTVGSAPDEKSFYGAANKRDGCTMVPFSRSKRKFRLMPHYAGNHPAQ